MITRMQMPRQLRDKGGIASVTPREKYGLGSKIKERVRKLIPNEIADVAVKAAPFVAPFFPGTAALMRGIGRFDQRGSISDALKQGIGTYAFGKAAGKLGGAESGEGFFGGQTYSMEGFKQGPVGSLFKSQEAPGTIKTASDTEKGVGIIKTATDATIGKIPGLKALPPFVQQQLFVGGITSGASALASYFQGDFREQEEGETMEEYLAARRDVVGKQMRVYMDNYYANDPEYSALDDAGKNAFVARYNVRDGGMPVGIMRSNKAGVMERDYRDEGGFVPVGIKEKADDVPAMLSKNEFVFTADAVRGAGNGSIEKGAQKMYDTMKNLERRVV
jgi:hypothetical protein|tara:strand:+ start:99 stop:1097 length:999 start_codon:yes stop_codon:yes gene_type:complete